MRKKITAILLGSAFALSERQPRQLPTRTSDPATAARGRTTLAPSVTRRGRRSRRLAASSSLTYPSSGNGLLTPIGRPFPFLRNAHRPEPAGLRAAHRLSMACPWVVGPPPTRP
jgi:hypothetical protein